MRLRSIDRLLLGCALFLAACEADSHKLEAEQGADEDGSVEAETEPSKSQPKAGDESKPDAGPKAGDAAKATDAGAATPPGMASGPGDKKGPKHDPDAAVDDDAGPHGMRPPGKPKGMQPHADKPGPGMGHAGHMAPGMPGHMEPPPPPAAGDADAGPGKPKGPGMPGHMEPPPPAAGDADAGEPPPPPPPPGAAGGPPAPPDAGP